MGQKDDENRNEYGFRKRKIVQAVEIGEDNVNEIRRENADKNGDDGDVVFLHETSGSYRGKYRQNLQLCESMEAEVMSGQMLTDMTINYASLLLHKQFSHISGFEDTELGCKDLFSAHNGRFMQILFSDSHWILAVGVELVTSDNNIRIFDSNNHNGELSEGFVRQIFSLRESGDEDLNISIEGVQQQSNGLDCGVLVLCFAVDLVHDLNPAERQYNLPKLRTHLHSCLVEGKFTPFPTFNRKVKKCPEHRFCIQPLEFRSLLSKLDQYDVHLTDISVVSKKKIEYGGSGDNEDELWQSSSVRKKVAKPRNTGPRSKEPDCRECKFCKNMKKYGGPGTLKKKCALKT